MSTSNDSSNQQQQGPIAVVPVLPTREEFTQYFQYVAYEVISEKAGAPAAASGGGGGGRGGGNSGQSGCAGAETTHPNPTPRTPPPHAPSRSPASKQQQSASPQGYKKFVQGNKDVAWAKQLLGAVSVVHTAKNHYKILLSMLLSRNMKSLHKVCVHITSSNTPPHRQVNSFEKCHITSVWQSLCIDVSKHSRGCGCGTAPSAYYSDCLCGGGHSASRAASSSSSPSISSSMASFAGTPCSSFMGSSVTTSSTTTAATTPTTTPCIVSVDCITTTTHESSMPYHSVERGIVDAPLYVVIGGGGVAAAAAAAAGDDDGAAGSSAPGSLTGTGSGGVFISPKFQHFAHMLWTVAKIDCVIKNYTSAWLQQQSKRTRLQLPPVTKQALTVQFTAECKDFCDSVCNIFLHAVCHVCTSLYRHMYDPVIITSMPIFAHHRNACMMPAPLTGIACVTSSSADYSMRMEMDIDTEEVQLRGGGGEALVLAVATGAGGGEAKSDSEHVKQLQ